MDKDRPPAAKQLIAPGKTELLSGKQARNKAILRQKDAVLPVSSFKRQRDANQHAKPIVDIAAGQSEKKKAPAKKAAPLRETKAKP
ncbi:hypothetical protein [Solimonas flava]|uniref:hypothetical protein n=1 Tax=Solimonas flava TaxID=415849 RepID=UPI0012B611DB|nr:hypothetical protein [Solimonas flava]